MTFFDDFDFYFRHGLEKMWQVSIPFILQLALCDMLFCVIQLPAELATYLSMVAGNKVVFPAAYCKFVGFMSTYLFGCGWTAQAIIAMSRAMLVTKRDWLMRYCETKWVLPFFMFPWLYTFLLIIPFITEVSIIYTKEFNIHIERKETDQFLAIVCKC